MGTGGDTGAVDDLFAAADEAWRWGGSGLLLVLVLTDVSLLYSDMLRFTGTDPCRLGAVRLEPWRSVLCFSL